MYLQNRALPVLSARRAPQSGCRSLALQAQEPASYPHDMSDYGCTNRDENACDSGACAATRLQPARRHVGPLFAAAQWLQRAAARRAAVCEVHERRLLVDDGVPGEPAEGQQAARAADDERTVRAIRQDGRRLGQLQQQRAGELSPPQSWDSAPAAARTRRNAHGGSKETCWFSKARARHARRRSMRASCRIRSSARRRSSARGSARRTP